MTTSSRVPLRTLCSALIVFALLAPCAFAGDVAVFGKNTVGTLASNGLNANYKRGSKFTLPQDAAISLLCAYLDTNGGASGTQQIRLALYQDANGVPTEKVAESQVLTFTNGDVANWYCGNLATDALPAGNYWFVIHSSGTPGIVRDYYDPAGNWYGNSDTFSDGAANQFGSGSAATGTISAYAFYETAPLSTRYAGRITTATVPSKGLTADYKRASAFTLSQPGRVLFASAYLDGHGGAVGTQRLRMVLYADANGVPGAKIAEMPAITISSGAPANWYTVNSSPTFLNPGRYWLALHTSGTGGVIRDYGDGPGNYYANADAFADGASNPFGGGSTGTATLSAYIGLHPGAFFSRTIGQTDVGTLISAGLRADHQRGSSFFTPDSDAVVTALYAYLDGSGGTAGSQQLRMCIYRVNKDGVVRERATESEIVTIPAGTRPGWVRFPVQDMPLSQYYGFAITIHSGATQGVVRYYYADPSTINWVGWSDTFADGPVAVAPSPSIGGGTLSVYAEYMTQFAPP